MLFLSLNETERGLFLMTDSFDPQEPTERELLEAIFRASLSEEAQQLPPDLLLDIAMDENAEESDSFSAVPPSHLRRKEVPEMTAEEFLKMMHGEDD